MNPNNNNNILPQDIWTRVVENPAVRRSVTQDSHLLFFHIYFPHYVKYETAPFQKELFAITEDESIKTAVIEAFRGSAKTSIVGMSYPIWAILGRQQFKYVLLLAHTQQQARQYLSSIKTELELNSLLRTDLGPFEEPDDEWRAQSIVLPKYGARISVASIDQPIRGTRHNAHRPDLIICDDLEDLESVRNRDTRNNLYDWLTGDIIPLGSEKTRTIIIGTRLHEDSLLMRVRRNILDGLQKGIVRSFPLLDEQDHIAWPGRFPTQESIEAEKMRVGDERAWQREYLLRIVGDIDQVISPDTIQFYDEIPPSKWKDDFTCISVDPAFSEESRADCSAIVLAEVHTHNDENYYYILPNPINQRMLYPELRERIKMFYANSICGRGTVVVESNGTQKMIYDDLKSLDIMTVPFQPGKMQKRERLMMVSPKIKSAHILFPRKGAEELLDQILNFGVARHDDLVDAFTALILATMTYHYPWVGFV